MRKRASTATIETVQVGYVIGVHDPWAASDCMSMLLKGEYLVRNTAVPKRPWPLHEAGVGNQPLAVERSVTDSNWRREGAIFPGKWTSVLDRVRARQWI